MEWVSRIGQKLNLSEKKMLDSEVMGYDALSDLPAA